MSRNAFQCTLKKTHCRDKKKSKMLIIFKMVIMVICFGNISAFINAVFRPNALLLNT
jgi:hypothetical protein